GGPLTLRNRLGVLILELLVRDEAGHWHAGSEITIDRPTELKGFADDAAVDAAVAEFLKVYQAHAPQAPAGLDLQNFGLRYWFAPASYGGTQYIGSDSQLESELSKVR